MIQVTKDTIVRYLFGEGEKSIRAGKLTPVTAIKLKCLDCSAGNRNEVNACEVHDCPLYPFRLGKPEWSRRKLSEEQREAIRQRAKQSGFGRK